MSCSLIVKDQQSQLGSVESMLTELWRNQHTIPNLTLQNEISILTSYSLTCRALEELDYFDITYTSLGRRNIAESKLYKSSPFVVLPDTNRSNIREHPIYITILSEREYRIDIDDKYNIRQVQKFGDVFVHDHFNFTLYLKQAEQYFEKNNFPRKFYFTINSANTLANKYRNTLNISVNDEKGSVLSLSMQGPASNQIADYLNKLCEVYIRSNLEEKNSVSENAIRFINSQMTAIKDSLQSADLRLQNFRSSNKVTDISREGNFMFEQLEELQSEKAILDINDRYYNYLKDYISNTIVSHKDLENNTSIPILGSAGHNTDRSELPVSAIPKSALAESFRTLRASLKFLLKNKTKKVIAITSVLSGEGKTFIALNLATALAIDGKKTLIIGLDLRRPKIYRVFNIPNNTGLSLHLIGNITAEEIIHPSNIQNLYVVNSGPVPPNPSELIGSEALTNFITAMKKEFDCIVIDTPPMAVVSDALLLKELTDIYLFVVRQKYSNKHVLKVLDEMYERIDRHRAYIVMNDVKPKKYYGYQYQGYGYGKYDKDYYMEKRNGMTNFGLAERIRKLFKIGGNKGCKEVGVGG